MKADLRSRFRKKRSSLANRKELALQASQHLIQLPEWQEAETILLYMAVGSEINTEFLISDAEERGKKILLPVTLDLKGNMGVGSYSAADMVQGNFTIPEPKIIDNYDLSKIDLVIVPAVAFDRQGGRLGQGKGYYDRFLSKTDAVRIGFCFTAQISETALPMEPHDAKMEIVVTDKEVIRCGR